MGASPPLLERLPASNLPLPHEQSPPTAVPRNPGGPPAGGPGSPTGDGPAAGPGRQSGAQPAEPPSAWSSTLSEVQGSARLASGGVAAEIERLRAEPGEGEIAIGGATLAAEAAASGLIDEYRAMVYPVLVGGGIPFFPRRERRVDLELVETRTFDSSVVYLRYRVAR